MPYFSLRDRVDTDSESSDDSFTFGLVSPRAGQRASSKLSSIGFSSRQDDYFGSIPKRQAFPREGQQQQTSSSKVPSVSSREDYFFAGRDCFSSKPAPAPVVKAPKAILPKPTPMGTASDSVAKAPKSILPKASPLHERGNFPVSKTPQRIVSKSPLAGAISVSESKTPKSSPLLQTGSVSLLKKPNSGFPKSSSVVKTPKTAVSLLVPSFPKPTPKTSASEFLDTQSSSSGLGSHLGILDSECQSEPDSPIEKEDFHFEEADVEVKPKTTVLPDWHGLLFGGVEKHCDEILTYPEVDTSFEDCKLAEDVALNFVANYNVPIFDCMRDFNNVNTVSHAVKKIPKKFKSRKEQLMALLLMLDYLSCCCQEGNLLTLYEKCKQKNKIYHIESLDQSIRLLLDRLHSDRLRLDQLRVVDKFVKTCIERIPKSLKIPYFSVPVALKRKLKVFEMEEKNRKENSVYNFSEQPKKNSPKKSKPSPGKVSSKKWKPSPAKMTFDNWELSPVKSTSNKWEPSPVKKNSNKWEPSPVKATSKKWVLEEMDYNDLLRTPTKSGQSTSVKSPLASTPRSPWSVSVPTTSSSGSVKRDFFSASPKDERKGSSSTSTARKSDPSKITHWLFQKNTTPRTNTGVTSLISKQREISKEVSKPNLSKKECAKVVLEADDYLSDDSLPDIPNIVVPKQESSSYTTWRRKVLGQTSAEVHSSDSDLNSSQTEFNRN
ncbi:uncharacterized protein LOC117648111 isoform X2 [Thrips palmi]|uniref:Uncharacterized protein LOC117648111 isoform X2 n=1 Tax=Thrips palmi TaxID=161013 RepID=A0A6P8ZQP7_THRPL|nr:uncharacterized protein LOC117648111 isoform X2 [Thrips palmi]